MKLFLWRGIVNGSETAIFALSAELEEAKAIAIKKAPGSVQVDVSKIVNITNPITFTGETSFIADLGLILF